MTIYSLPFFVSLVQDNEEVSKILGIFIRIIMFILRFIGKGIITTFELSLGAIFCCVSTRTFYYLNINQGLKGECKIKLKLYVVWGHDKMLFYRYVMLVLGQK